MGVGVTSFKGLIFSCSIYCTHLEDKKVNYQCKNNVNNANNFLSSLLYSQVVNDKSVIRVANS